MLFKLILISKAVNVGSNLLCGTLEYSPSLLRLLLGGLIRLLYQLFKHKKMVQRANEGSPSVAFN